MPPPDYFKNRQNNPSPEDFSLYEPLQADPIRVTNAETLTVPAISPGDVDVQLSPSGKLQRIQFTPGRTLSTSTQNLYLQERGSNNSSVNQDAPEDDYIEEGDFETGSSYVTDDGSETGSPIGLNASARTKTKIADSKPATSINQGPFMEDLSKIQINPRKNELNRFSSVTYNIALYMMNSKSYVNLLTQPRLPQDALSPPNSYLLMRSGGVGFDGGGTDFSNDFFIDDLEISNVAVGPSKFKANTNATDIRFTITEPRGVTLLERLQRVAGSVMASTREKYIHAPYLLEITFKGYDENGTPMPASSTPKYIPIRLIDMQFDVSASGTQYKCQAIPFANHAMGSIMGTIPFNIELQASTVGDIFSAGVIVEETVQTTETVRVNPRETTTQERIVKKKKKSKAKNLGEILTNYQRKRTLQSTALTEKNFEVVEKPVPPAAEKYDSYKFLIAGEIAEAKLNLSELYDALNTPAPTEEAKEKDDSKTKGDKRQFDAYVRGIGQGITLDKETQTFKINAGTSITKLLNLVILHSDYMDANIVENPSSQVSEGGGINWFKIRPVIESAESVGGGMDNKDGRYKYLITHAVEKNKIYYSDFPWAKKSKPTGVGVHKNYDYLFSGTNTEVLDFDLKFRTAFIQVMTAGTGAPFGNKTADENFAGVVKELPQSIEGNTINTQDNLKRARAKDLFSSVMSDGVDMIDLNLQIVGDPAFIPTSDAFWQDKVRQGQQYTESFMPDGTINYNLTPPFIRVNLRTPVDYDENSGLANPSRYGNSSFSGVYQVTSVDSTFSGGRFEQRLNGFRAMLQPTANGVARSEAQTAGIERNRFAKEAANTFAGGDLLGEFNTKPKTDSGVARVINPFEEDRNAGVEYEEVYTSSTVNNARTQQIARDQQDRSVDTITDNNPDQSEAWATRYTAYPDGAI